MRIAWLILLGLVLAAGSAAAASDVNVGRDDPASKIAFLRYFPDTIVVNAGDTVTWKAASFTPHTVTSSGPGQAFDSSPGLDLTAMSADFGPGGFLLPSQSFNHTFTHLGVYHYFCKIHPGMAGTITVVAEGSMGRQMNVTAGMGRDDTSVDRFEPENLTVPYGTKVVWTNGHNYEPHTVTSPGGDEAFDSSPQVGMLPAAFYSAQGVLTMGGNNTQFSFRFPTAGTYTYGCKLHPAMQGTVVVLAAAAKSPGLPSPLVLGLLGLVGICGRRWTRG